MVGSKCNAGSGRCSGVSIGTERQPLVLPQLTMVHGAGPSRCELGVLWTELIVKARSGDRP